jgi:DNA-directed RNA polymerase specialized sigma24 family protein
VPRALIEPLRPAPADDEGLSVADVADPHDQYEEMDSEIESERILTYLSDPLDRMIMVLRGIDGMKWDDIATLCKRTERTVRLRYERARRYLSERINNERQVLYTPPIIQQQ